MAVVLRKHYVARAWQDKIPKAVYRGSCYPTANPDANDPDKYLFIRGGLCETVSKKGLNGKLFDVGMFLWGGEACIWSHCSCPHLHLVSSTGTIIDPDYVQDELSPYCTGAFYSKLCAACAPCNSTIQPMTRDELAQYKYQVVLCDGWCMGEMKDPWLSMILFKHVQVSVEGYGPTADAIYVCQLLV